MRLPVLVKSNGTFTLPVRCIAGDIVSAAELPGSLLGPVPLVVSCARGSVADVPDAILDRLWLRARIPGHGAVATPAFRKDEQCRDEAGRFSSCGGGGGDSGGAAEGKPAEQKPDPRDDSDAARSARAKDRREQVADALRSATAKLAGPAKEAMAKLGEKGKEYLSKGASAASAAFKAAAEYAAADGKAGLVSALTSPIDEWILGDVLAKVAPGGYTATRGAGAAVATYAASWAVLKIRDKLKGKQGKAFSVWLAKDAATDEDLRGAAKELRKILFGLSDALGVEGEIPSEEKALEMVRAGLTDAEDDADVAGAVADFDPDEATEEAEVAL